MLSNLSKYNKVAMASSIVMIYEILRGLWLLQFIVSLILFIVYNAKWMRQFKCYDISKYLITIIWNNSIVISKY
jgi:hypothetical protein